MTARALVVVAVGAVVVAVLSFAPACAHQAAVAQPTCVVTSAGDGGYVLRCR